MEVLWGWFWPLNLFGYDGYCRFPLAPIESLPLQLHLAFLGGAFCRDVPELDPLVDLGIPLRILSHEFSVPSQIAFGITHQ